MPPQTTSNSMSLIKKCFLCSWSDGVPSSQNPTVAIESWINHNKVEREEFSCILQENLKVKFYKSFLWGNDSAEMPEGACSFNLLNLSEKKYSFWGE